MSRNHSPATAQRAPEVPGFPVPEVIVELRGRIAEDLPGYARAKIAAVLARTGRRVLHSRLRVVRHADPARERPVSAHAVVDLAGHAVQVHTDAGTPREAVDLLVDRLAHRLERRARGKGRHSSRRGRRGSAGGPEPDGREVVRTTTISPAPCSVATAVAELEDLAQEFHLFVDSTRDVDSVVYRAGPTGLRLAQVDGGAAAAVPDGGGVTASPHPAPLHDLAEALERLELSGLPFLFYLDADHARGCVVHRRGDGRYGLVRNTRRRP